MSKQQALKKIKIVSQRIAKEYSPEKVVLFGSYAWGKPNKDSDFDLLIIKNRAGDFLRAQQRVRRIIDGEVAADILIHSPRHIEQRLKMGDFFFEDIINKGIILYDKQ